MGLGMVVKESTKLPCTYVPGCVSRVTVNTAHGHHPPRKMTKLKFDQRYVQYPRHLVWSHVRYNIVEDPARMTIIPMTCRVQDERDE